MINHETHISRDYLEAVFDRATTPLDPTPFFPNWQDQPSLFKLYRQVERLSLPTSRVKALPLAQVLASSSAVRTPAGALQFDTFSALLLFAHGVLDRRIDIKWNGDAQARTQYSHAIYGRGTPSGGGRYPTEIYWACGRSGPMLTGLYHYDPAHHALERLAVGDMTSYIQNAVFNYPSAMTTDHFLLITLNFCYHAVTQDLGTLLCSLRFIARGFTSDLPTLWWYRDEALNRMLGLTTLAESVFVVLPVLLKARHSASRKAESEGPESGPKVPTVLHHPLVVKESWQRSKEIITFPLVEAVHRAALIDNDPCSPISSASSAICDYLEAADEFTILPRPLLETLQQDMLSVLQQRRSSFGNLSNYQPLSHTELATLLYAAQEASHYTSDLKHPDGTPSFTRLMVFINHVEGIHPGVYAYDGKRQGLWTVRQGDHTSFLQRQYNLPNYNLAETAVMITIVGRPERMLKVYGNRGYRVLNAEAGSVAQAIYLAAAALSLGCGAVLGFNNRAINSALGIEESDQRSLLFLLVGRQRRHDATFEARFL